MTGTKHIRLSKCSLGDEELQAVARVFKNEYLGMGKEVQAFENEIKEYLGTNLDVICTVNATAALQLAMESIDLPPDSEILIPSITYVASFQAAKAAGIKPVACDVLETNVLIDLHDAEKRITKKTKAIMPVHYASNPSQIADVYEFAEKYGLRVIEDSAQSFGCRRNGRNIGSEGDTLCFSLDGIKNITSGEGGIIITSDKEVARKARDGRLLSVDKDTEKRFSNDRSWKFDVYRQGHRFHMSDIMAAIGRAQLKKIDRFSEKRCELATQYLKNLANLKGLELFDTSYDEVVPHIFVIKVLDGNRDRLAEFLKEKNIATGIHYFPNHLLNYFKTDYALPVSEKLFEQILTLPLHVDLTNADIDYVSETIRSFLKDNV